MIRAIRRASLLVAFLLLASAATVGAEGWYLLAPLGAPPLKKVKTS